MPGPRCCRRAFRSSRACPATSRRSKRLRDCGREWRLDRLDLDRLFVKHVPPVLVAPGLRGVGKSLGGAALIHIAQSNDVGAGRPQVMQIVSASAAAADDGDVDRIVGRDLPWLWRQRQEAGFHATWRQAAQPRAANRIQTPDG